MTLVDKNAMYTYVNHGEVSCLREIADRSICIDGDIGGVLEFL